MTKLREWPAGTPESAGVAGAWPVLKRLWCRISGFVQTYLDPHIWRAALNGKTVQVSGHVHDFARTRYEVREGRELEWAPCERCGEEVLLGWRYMA